MSDTFDWEALEGIDWAEIARRQEAEAAADENAQSGDDGAAPEPDPDDGTTPVKKDPVETAEEKEVRRAAEITLETTLTGYGLEDLIPWAWEQLRSNSPISQILLAMRDEDPYKKRFPGMKLRSDNGHKAISPGDYLIAENAFKQTMAAAKMPAGFFDSPDDFGEWIGNNVSDDEIVGRISMAAEAVRSVNPALKTQLQDLYGIGVENDGELIAYFLDPERAVGIIEQRLQMDAAGLSAAAVRTVGSGIDRKTSEQLAGANIQAREIGDRLKGQAGLVNHRLLGEKKKLTTSEAAAAEFGLDSDATAQVRSLRQRREESTRRRSGVLATNVGATGLGSAT
jgi:hypothetical protein